MRKRTGLRNKFRTGKSTYAKRKKGAQADRYGSYVGGELRSSETIAGTLHTEQLPSMDKGHKKGKKRP
jgi:hypothetical protein